MFKIFLCLINLKVFFHKVVLILIIFIEENEHKEGKDIHLVLDLIVDLHDYTIMPCFQEKKIIMLTQLWNNATFFNIISFLLRNNFNLSQLISNIIDIIIISTHSVAIKQKEPFYPTKNQKNSAYQTWSLL